MKAMSFILLAAFFGNIAPSFGVQDYADVTRGAIGAYLYHVSSSGIVQKILQEYEDIDWPMAVKVDIDGNYVVLDRGLLDDQMGLYRISQGGSVTPIFTQDLFADTSNQLSSPANFVIDRSGNYVIADEGAFTKIDEHNGGVYRVTSSGLVDIVADGFEATGVATDENGDYVATQANSRIEGDYEWWDNAVLRISEKGRLLAKMELPQAVYLRDVIVDHNGNYALLDMKSQSRRDPRRPQYDYDSLYLMSPSGNILGEWHIESAIIYSMALLADNSYILYLVAGENEFGLFKLSAANGRLEAIINKPEFKSSDGIAISQPIKVIPNNGSISHGDRIVLTAKLDPCHKRYDLYLIVIYPDGNIMSISWDGNLTKDIKPYAENIAGLQRTISKEVLSLAMPKDTLKGAYAIYSCLVPSDESPSFSNSDYTRRCYVTVQ